MNNIYSSDELASERWKPVYGFEEFYAVSNLGRVRRTKRGCSHLRPLKAYPDKYGYPQVVLSVYGKRHYRRCHQLVATTFIGPYPPGMEINHIDATPANPRLENLEYVTDRENQVHALIHGLQPTAKLNEAAVQVIRYYREKLGFLRTRIAKVYGIHPATVTAVVQRTSWGHVPSI